MTREELIKQCRYYKGEKECPNDKREDEMLWFYEERWCTFCIERPEYIEEIIKDYNNTPFSDFSNTDGVPLSLKALLFNRYCHWSGGYGLDVDNQGFKDWYNTYYKKG